MTTVMSLCSNALRGSIIASPGKKLVCADLEQIDAAFCDTIERVDRARGCGWYGRDGRLNHRPAPFERAAA